jgi:hypothetical protein
MLPYLSPGIVIPRNPTLCEEKTGTKTGTLRIQTGEGKRRRETE